MEVRFAGHSINWTLKCGTNIPFEALHAEFCQKILQILHLCWSQLNLHFLLTNYSFGKSVRTSTLCMIQVVFSTIVYRQIISLIIHCITIPVGQKFKYTKLTVPLNSLENSRKLCHGFRSF